MSKPPDPGIASFPRSRLLRVNVVSGIVLILVGLAAWLEVAPLDTGTMRYFGPGMLPRALSILVVVTGTVVLGIGLLRNDAAAEHLRASLRGPGMVAVALVVFAATIRGADIAGTGIPQLGLVVAGPLAVVIAGFATPEANLRDLGALGFGLTAGCAALFNDVLGMTIPVLPKALETAVEPWIGSAEAVRLACAAYAALAVVILVYGPHPAPCRPEEPGG